MDYFKGCDLNAQEDGQGLLRVKMGLGHDFPP